MQCVPHRVVLLSALAVLLALCPSAGGQEAVGLRYQFKKGDQFSFNVANTQIMKMTSGEEVQFVHMLSNVDVHWQVQDVDKNGKAKIAGTLKRVRLEMNSGDDPTTNMVLVDSTQENFKENELYKLFGPLVKKGLTWSMDRRGEVTDLKVPDEVLKVITDEPQLAGIPAEAWGLEMFHTMFHPTALVFPEGAPAKDKSWKSKGREAKFADLFNMKQQSEFHLDGTEKRDSRQLQTIAIKPTISVEMGEQGKQAGLKMTGGEGKGKVLVDLATGMFMEAQLTISIAVGSTDGAGMAIQLRQMIAIKPTEKAK